MSGMIDAANPGLPVTTQPRASELSIPNVAARKEEWAAMTRVHGGCFDIPSTVLTGCCAIGFAYLSDALFTGYLVMPTLAPVLATPCADWWASNFTGCCAHPFWLWPSHGACHGCCFGCWTCCSCCNFCGTGLHAASFCGYAALGCASLSAAYCAVSGCAICVLGGLICPKELGDMVDAKFAKMAHIDQNATGIWAADAPARVHEGGDAAPGDAASGGAGGAGGGDAAPGGEGDTVPLTKGDAKKAAAAAKKEAAGAKKVEAAAKKEEAKVAAAAKKEAAKAAADAKKEAKKGECKEAAKAEPAAVEAGAEATGGTSEVELLERKGSPQSTSPRYGGESEDPGAADPAASSAASPIKFARSAKTAVVLEVTLDADAAAATSSASPAVLAVEAVEEAEGALPGTGAKPKVVLHPDLVARGYKIAPSVDAVTGNVEGAAEVGARAEWTVLAQCDVFPKQDHLVRKCSGDATSLAAAKVACLSAGCGGFVLNKGKAYFRKHTQAELLTAAKAAGGQVGRHKESTLYVAPEATALASPPKSGGNNKAADKAPESSPAPPKRPVVKLKGPSAASVSAQPGKASSPSPLARDDGTGSRQASSLDRPAPTARSASASRLGTQAAAPPAPSTRDPTPTRSGSAFRERRSESRERDRIRSESKDRLARESKERPAAPQRTVSSGSTV